MSIFASLLVVGFVSDGTASGPFGYRDTGFDADDAKDAVDIRSTTRKIWQDKKAACPSLCRAFHTPGR